MGERLGERAENTAKLPVSPSPNAARPNPLPGGARGLIEFERFLSEQHYAIAGSFRSYATNEAQLAPIIKKLEL